MSAKSDFTSQDGPWLKLRQAANIFHETEQQNKELYNFAMVVALVAVETILRGGCPVPRNFTRDDLDICHAVLTDLIRREVTK
jgi:hypothetical protein